MPGSDNPPSLEDASSIVAGRSAKERAERSVVTVALLFAMAVVALEQTVVSTAMPTIINEFKAVDSYPWLFSAYLLASTVTTPIYGKLADIYGRKRLLLFGLGLFSVGSILSGLANSIAMLIAMRTVQGLGAGAVAPIILTLMADLFTMEERARVQGLFSGVWGVSSVAGPMIGGRLTDLYSWRWVFYISVPFSVAAAWVLAAYVKEPDRVAGPKRPIDWLGAALLASGSSMLLLGVIDGPASSSGWTVAYLAGSAVLLGAFLLVERRSPEPILPIDLLSDRAIMAAVMGSFLLGILMFAIDTYVPLYIQGVRGTTATEAGQAVTWLFLSWAISVAVAAKVVLRFGFKATALVGMALIALGMMGLAVGAIYSGLTMPIFRASLAMAGIGFGPASLCCVLSVQNAVDWDRRGAATGTIQFFRTMGGAVGVAILGASLSLDLGSRLKADRAADVEVADVLRPETRSKIAPDRLKLVQSNLGLGLRDVYWQMTVLAIGGVVCASRLAGGRATSRPSTTPFDRSARIPAGTQSIEV